MPWPNFLVIGAAKCGTTSLYYYLKQHPQIYMSAVKEPKFFAFYGEELNESQYDQLSIARFKKLLAGSITNLEDYLALFNAVTNEKAIGEASTVYLQAAPRAAAYIHRFIPHVKLIAILRNPSDRTYSDFLMERDGKNAPTDNFLDAIALENIHEVNRPWEVPWYIRRSFYDMQLQHYFKFFTASQLRVFLYEDLKKPVAMVQEIFRFLQVDDAFQPEVSSRYNVAKARKQYFKAAQPRGLNPIWRAAIKVTPESLRTKLNYVLPPPLFRWYMSRRQGRPTKVLTKNFQQIPVKKLKETQCPPEVREKLRPIFRDHVLRLQDMIQRDLSHWLT